MPDEANSLLSLQYTKGFHIGQEVINQDSEIIQLKRFILALAIKTSQDEHCAVGPDAAKESVPSGVRGIKLQDDSKYTHS